MTNQSNCTHDDKHLDSTLFCIHKKVKFCRICNLVYCKKCLLTWGNIGIVNYEYPVYITRQVEYTTGGTDWNPNSKGHC